MPQNDPFLGACRTKFRPAALVLVSLLFVANSWSQEQSKVEENCAKSDLCVRLKNERPDYSQVEALVLEIIDAIP